jgi:hypothetical protein
MYRIPVKPLSTGKRVRRFAAIGLPTSKPAQGFTFADVGLTAEGTEDTEKSPSRHHRFPEPNGDAVRTVLSSQASFVNDLEVLGVLCGEIQAINVRRRKQDSDETGFRRSTCRAGNVDRPPFGSGE